MRIIKFNTPTSAWISIVVMISMSSCADSSSSSNWFQFRGPDANMVFSGENLPDHWSGDQNVAWTYEVEGEGWASPVVWENKVFLATVVAEKINKPGEGTEASEQENQDLYLQDLYRWEVSCVDIQSGKELWKRVAHQGNPRGNKHANTNYASETPVTDGERLYVYFGMTGLFCYDLAGELLWEKDLGAYETMNGWGTGSSPLLFNDILYVQVDNEENSFLVALNSESGEEIWRIKRDEKTSYSTPYIWKNSVQTELVTGGLWARSYDPVSGKLLWELRMDGRYNIPGPASDRDFLYIGNPGFRDIPATFASVRAGAKGDITPDSGQFTSEGVAWSNPEAPLGNPSPLLYNGLLYLLSSRGGELTCLEAETGAMVYQEKIENVAACWASPWVQNDKIFFFDEKGLTRVIKAGREFELLHENSLDDRFWASVAFAGDALLIKGDKKLYCIKK